MQIKGKKIKIEFNAVQILSIGFFILILIGGIILSLPISSASGESTNLLDSIFTSTSAVCVTGLITLDTGTHFSVFGQVIIITLIEIGGLGFMSFATMIAVILGKKITLKDRLIMQEALNAFSIQGMVKMVKYVIKFTLLIQLIGAIILSTQFIPEFGLKKGIGFSLFHSISAFCNAGFDLFGHFSSLVNHNTNSVILITISSLIIIGGLGFTVWIEIYNYRKTRRLSLHSKLVLLITIFLLVLGTILFLVLEYNNSNTIAQMGIKDKLLNSYFSSATARTAGFNSVDTNGTTNGGKLLTVLLMFIGGSPGSTAGGIKTVTFGVIILAVVAVIKGREEPEIFKRSLSKELVYRSFAILVIALTLVLTVSMVLSITLPNEKFIDLLYEVTSAFGTVGITTGVTQRLTVVGKVIIMITMYLGRLGALTFAFAITKRKKKQGIRYPKGKILIG